MSIILDNPVWGPMRKHFFQIFCDYKNSWIFTIKLYFDKFGRQAQDDKPNKKQNNLKIMKLIYFISYYSVPIYIFFSWQNRMFLNKKQNLIFEITSFLKCLLKTGYFTLFCHWLSELNQWTIYWHENWNNL